MRTPEQQVLAAAGGGAVLRLANGVPGQEESPEEGDKPEEEQSASNEPSPQPVSAPVTPNSPPGATGSVSQDDTTKDLSSTLNGAAVNGLLGTRQLASDAEEQLTEFIDGLSDDQEASAAEASAAANEEVRLTLHEGDLPLDFQSFMSNEDNRNNPLKLQGLHVIDAAHLLRAAEETDGERAETVLCVHGTSRHHIPSILAHGFRGSEGPHVYAKSVCVSPNITESLGYTDAFDAKKPTKLLAERSSRGTSNMLIVCQLHYDGGEEGDSAVVWCNRAVGHPQACRIPELVVPRYLAWYGPDDELARRLDDFGDEMCKAVQKEMATSEDMDDARSGAAGGGGGAGGGGADGGGRSSAVTAARPNLRRRSHR
jgi:hypothetical protein